MFIGIALRNGRPYVLRGAGGPVSRRLSGVIAQESEVSGSLTNFVELTAQRSASGFVGYSSFEDDAFGDVTFPSAVLTPDKPLLALMSLPGGGDYVVFDKDSRSELAGQRIVLGGSSAVVAEADAFSYNSGGNDRTQLVYLDKKFTIVEGEVYPVSVEQYDGDEQELQGFLSQTQPIAARLSIQHNLSAALVQPNLTVAHLHPPITLRGGIIQESEFDAAVVAAAHLQGFVSQTNVFDGNLDQKTFRRLSGVLSQSSVFSSNLTVAPAPVELGVTFDGGGAFAAGVPISYDSDAVTIFSAMSVAPDDARKDLINTTIAALKSDGLWAKIDMLYMFAAHDEQAGRVNWRNPAITATRHNAAKFTTDGGFSGNGSSMYLSLNWAPSDAIAGSRSGSTWNYHIGAKGFAHAGANEALLGDAGADSVNALLTAYHSSFSGGVSGGIGYTGGAPIFSYANTDRANHAIIAVNGNNKSNFRSYQNGVLKGGATANGSGVLASVNATDGIFALRNSSTYSSLGIQYAHAGANLTDTDVANLYSILSNYLANLSIITETADLVASMTTAPDSTRKAHIDTTMRALKDAGILQRMDFLYFNAAHDAQAARLNWARRQHDQTLIGSPLFTVDVGYKGVGSSGYLNCNFVGSQALHASRYDHCMFGIADAGYASGTGAMLGTSGTTGTGSLRIEQQATNIIVRSGSNSSDVFDVGADSGGKLSLFSRDGTPGFDFYYDGEFVETKARISTATLPEFPMYAAAFYNIASGAGSNIHTAESVAVYGFGQSLNATQAEQLNDIINAYKAGL